MAKNEKEILSQFEEWILSRDDIINPRLEKPFLMRFLRSRKFNVDEACKVFEKYIRVRTLHPHCYMKLDIQDPGIYDLMRRGYLFPLLEKDSLGRTVIFGRGAMFKEKYGHEPTHLYRAIIMTLETLLDDEDNQKNGFVYIFDQQDVSLSDLTYLGIWEMRKLAQSGEKALPVKHKEVHWLNLPSIITAAFYFISNFLSPKLRSRLIFHHNTQSLQQSFPPSILPKEYGGTVPISVMVDHWLVRLVKNRERLLALDTMKYKNGNRHHRFFFM